MNSPLIVSQDKNVLIEHLKSENLLPFADFALADYLMKTFGGDSKTIYLLLHLAQAVKAGHLCIKITEHEVVPKPQDVWELNEDKQLSPSQWDEIERMICLAAKDLPPTLITRVNQEDISPITPLCQYQNLFYFQKYWNFEAQCFQKLSSLIHEKPSLAVDSQKLLDSLKQLLSNNSLTSEQSQAILQLENHVLTIISGGPGTGKTYTVGLLIRVFWEALSKTQQERCKIALAAPTGKAAANLEKSLSHATEKLVDFPPVTATTIHSLLGLKSISQEQHSLISADLLIIDECSMIDIRLMAKLLLALKPGARLILLGDPFQLPPVGAGSFFADMIHICPSKHVVELQKCHRSDLKALASLAAAIKNRSSQAALHLFDSHPNVLNFHLLPEKQLPSQIQQLLWEKAYPYLERCLKTPSQENLNLFRILSPLRKGVLGVDQLNAFFYKEIMKRMQGSNDCITFPIMITANDPQHKLFNGDIGFLIKKNPTNHETTFQTGDYAVFGERKIPAIFLPSYEYSFCLSVHKSQGSEFDHILLLLPEGSERFGRELVYTAVTRARKKLEIWSTPLLFEKTVNNAKTRLSQTKVN